MKIDQRFLWDYTVSDTDLNDDAVRRWYVARVLTRGALADIQALGVDAIRRVLPSLVLPSHTRRFWERYFALLDRTA